MGTVLFRTAYLVNMPSALGLSFELKAMNAIMILLILLPLAIHCNDTQDSCRTNENARSVSERDIATALLYRDMEVGDSLLSTTLLKTIPQLYDITDPYAQRLNGQLIIEGVHKLVSTTVTDELQCFAGSFDPIFLTDNIMSRLSDILPEAIKKRSELLAEKRHKMELERLALLENDIKTVLWHTFTKTSASELADTVITKVSELVTNNTKKILSYPVVKEEVQRSVSTVIKDTDGMLTTNSIYNALVPFLLEGLQSDISESIDNLHYVGLENKLAGQLSYTIVELVQQALRDALQLEILVEKQLEEKIFTKNFIPTIKPMIRRALISSMKEWEEGSRKEFYAIRDLPAVEFVNSKGVITRFLNHFTFIYKITLEAYIVHQLHEVLHKVATFDRPLPEGIVESLESTRLIIDQTFNEILETDLVHEVELYRRESNN